MARGGKLRRRLTKRQLTQKYASARKELRVLQSKGLVAKSANLSKPRPSLALRKKLETLRPVLTGEVQAVRVPASKAKDFASSGYRVLNNRVLVPTVKGETAKYVPSRYVRGKYVTNDTIRITNEKGSPTGYLERILIPLDFEHFKQFNEWLQADPNRLQSLLPADAIIGFTYFGNRSRETGDAHWLASYLLKYQLLFDNDKSEEAFGTLEFWGMSADVALNQWETGREENRRVGTPFKRQRNNVDATGRTVKSGQRAPRMARTPAEQTKLYRQRIKEDPIKYEKHKASERERVTAYKKRIKSAFTLDRPRTPS